MKPAEWQRRFRRTERGKAHTKRMNLRKIGWSPERFTIMLYAQGGLCAACQQPEYGENQHGRMSLAADHNHDTMEPRGLLCHRCNRALGLLGDDPGRVEQLARYRRRYA